MVETIGPMPNADPLPQRQRTDRRSSVGGDPPNALYPNRRGLHKGIEPERLDVGIVHQWRRSPGPPHLHITSEARVTQKAVEPMALREGVSWQDGGGIDTFFRPENSDSAIAPRGS